MTGIANFLEKELVKSERLVILGVGSCLMADDAAGMMLAEALIARFGEEPAKPFLVIAGSNAPECFTGEIKRFRPDHVLIVDAADTGGAPGELCSIDPADVAGVSFSTHMLPLKVMLDYLVKETGCRTSILGIQPRCLEFGGEMTPEVRWAVDELIVEFGEYLSKL